MPVELFRDIIEKKAIPLLRIYNLNVFNVPITIVASIVNIL